jgi:hypothetical protein
MSQLRQLGLAWQLPPSRRWIGAFADGHAIVKRWVDGRTCAPVAKGASWEFDEFQPENPDIRWLQECTTGRK